jgi:hypothetical protein
VIWVGLAHNGNKLRVPVNIAVNHLVQWNVGTLSRGYTLVLRAVLRSIDLVILI